MFFNRIFIYGNYSRDFLKVGDDPVGREPFPGEFSLDESYKRLGAPAGCAGKLGLEGR